MAHTGNIPDRTEDTILTLTGIKQKLTPEQAREIDTWEMWLQEGLVEMANDPSRGIDYIQNNWAWLNNSAKVLAGF